MVAASASPGSASPCSLSFPPGHGAGREHLSAAGLYGAPGTVGTGVWGPWVSREGSRYVSPRPAAPGGLARPSRRPVPCAPGGAAIAAG